MSQGVCCVQDGACGLLMQGTGDTADDSSPCTAQVMEHARARGETAIGWLSGEGPLHLAPPALERNTYKDGDRIIVVRCFAKHIRKALSALDFVSAYVLCGHLTVNPHACVVNGK